MRVLSVAEVHGGSGVELAGGEELVHAHPLVSVVRDLTISRPRGDDGYAGPCAQVRAIRGARNTVVPWLLSGKVPAGRSHRPHQRVLHRSLSRRALLYHLQVRVEIRVFGLQLRETFFEALDELLV